MASTKTCNHCGELKPLDQFGWRYKGTDRQRQEARCKPCRAKINTNINRRMREAKEMKAYEETACPCDSCFKQSTCTVECVSFRCWSEHGI